MLSRIKRKKPTIVYDVEGVLPQETVVKFEFMRPPFVTQSRLCAKIIVNLIGFKGISIGEQIRRHILSLRPPVDEN